MKYPEPGRRPTGLFLLLLGIHGLVWGCSTEAYRRAADEEALAIIQEKQKEVFGQKRPFQVETPEDASRKRLLEAVEMARRDKDPERKPRPLMLDRVRCLEVAAFCSREFQNQKEALFLSALSLSTTRWEFDWQPSLTGAIGVDGNRRDADVSGSAEALRGSLEGQSIEDVRVRVIHSGVGPINKSDVLLAQASEAIIVGFHVKPLTDARLMADKEGIEIRTYRIIYAAIEDIRAAMLGMLEPEKKEIELGSAEVRQVIRVPKRGMFAGSYCTKGKVTRDALVRVMRLGKEIFNGKVTSLRRFKDDAKEVETGYECGIGIEGADELAEGDTLEFYKVEEVKRTS